MNYLRRMVIGKLRGGSIALAVTTAILTCPSLLVQPAAGEVQPDALRLGTVRVGATVEASVRIFEDGDDTAGVPVDVAPPPFVKITDVKLGTQSYGSSGTKTFCDISVSLKTSDPGEFSGAVKVHVGGQEVDVPISATVLQTEPGLTHVLIAETPFEKFSTSDASLFNAWLNVVKSGKLDPHYLNVTRSEPVLRDLDLSKFDVVFLSGLGLICAVDTDLKKLSQFLNDGGRIVVAANYFLRGTVEKANQIIDSFGLKIDDVEDGTNNFEVAGEEISQDVFTSGVKILKFYRASPIKIVEPAAAKILVAAPPYPEQAFAAVARSGKAEIVALGASLWWNWIGNADAQQTDNARLLQNVLAKPHDR